MTPDLSREATEAVRQERIDRYKKAGFTRNDYEKEIVKGCNLPWEQVKAKAFALTCYREETGIKPTEKIDLGDKPILIITKPSNGGGNGETRD